MGTSKGGGHGGHKPFKCGGGNRGPNQSLDIGIEQWFGEHPSERVSDYAKLSVIHRAFPSCIQSHTLKRSFG